MASKIISRITALSIALHATSAVAQNELTNLFGGLIQTAIAQAAQKEWRRIPQAELGCVDRNLQQSGLSISRLIQQGIVPSDPRVASVRADCRLGPPLQQTTQAQASVPPAMKSRYVVDGFSIGSQVKDGKYQEYRCGASKHFPDLTYCVRSVDEAVSRGSFTSNYEMLYSSSGDVVYVSRQLEPAWFSEGEASNDINQRAKRFGAAATSRLIPANSNDLKGVIAYWGDIALTEVDKSTVAQIRRGEEPPSILVDYLGNVNRSVQQSLPIFQVSGGSGYVWAASWNKDGVGVLRFFAVDAKSLMSFGASETRPPRSVSESGVRVSSQTDANSYRVFDRQSKSAPQSHSTQSAELLQPKVAQAIPNQTAKLPTNNSSNEWLIPIGIFSLALLSIFSVRVRKRLLSIAVPDLARTLSKALIQVKQGGSRWQTVRRVEDKELTILLAYQETVAAYPNSQVRALSARGETVIKSDGKSQPTSEVNARAGQENAKAVSEAVVSPTGAESVATTLELLEKLQNLKAAGLLTEEEFDHQKKKLLS